MKYKKSMIIIMLAIFLFSITAVCASEMDTPVASEDTGQLELSVNEEGIEDNLQTSEENTKLAVDENDETLSSELDSEILTADQFTYSNLREQIGSGGNINLTKGTYTYNDGDGDTIQITTPGVINGNGAVIDMNKSNMHVFIVSAENVTLNNITFMNVDFNDYGGAVYFNATHGSVTNCYFKDNQASLGSSIFFDGEYGSVINSSFVNNSARNAGGAIFAKDNYFRLINCNFTNNSAWYGGAIDFEGSGTVSNCNFTGNNASGDGGAIWIYSGTVTNCNFTNNQATGTNSWGGAVYFDSDGDVTNCNFTDNSATVNGGAVFFHSTGNVTNCNFTDNIASIGGAIYIYSGNVTNCNFTDNSATVNGGAVFFHSTCNVTNCNFTGNTATGDGGAVYFNSNGEMTNCNFVDNKAAGDYSDGGAVYFNSNGEVTNCNFTDNTASYGGAVYFYGTGSVTNCNFTDNSATVNGGAVYFNSNSEVTNCNFVDNKATGDYSYGGAVYFYGTGSVTNCNFTDNSATYYGGAVHFRNVGEVTNCNFVDNSAFEGGAIFSMGWYTTADTCIFKKNSGDNVNTVIYPPTLNVNNFTTVYGSGEKLTFDLKTNSSIPVTNGNISISVYFKDNGVWVRNYTCLSGEGWIPDLPVGSYIAVFNTEYAEFQKINRTVTITLPNVRYSINVTSLTTNNRTVNITAKTDIPKNILWEGKLLFIVPTGENITANYAGNGTWWAVYEFADYGDYQVNATYVGLDNVTINNGTISCKISTEIIINTTSLDLFVGDEIVIVANLTPADAGNVTFTSSNESVVEVDVQGNVIAQGKGQAIITVSFAGNNKYAAAENRTINVTVSLNDASITVDNNTLNLKAGETYAINATKHPDTIMLDITYTSSNSSVVTVDKKGIVTAVGVGTAVITVEVGDDEIYAKNSTNVTVTVSKASTEIGAKPVTATYNINKNLIITLKDANGNPVTGVSLSVDLNGAKKYTTDKNGQVKVSTKGLDPKTYTAKITFNGNTNYVKSSKNVKVTVKKAKPKIIAKKKKTYRAKAKTKKLKITLKDNTGKPIKNAKVRLMLKKIGKGSKKKTKSKANKKIAKTNKKGKATFKVKKNKKAKYQAYVKFYANKYYMKTVKKIKITIK